MMMHVPVQTYVNAIRASHKGFMWSRASVDVDQKHVRLQ